MSNETKPLPAEDPAARPPFAAASENHVEEDGELGSIHIHNGVIAVIARIAAEKVDGVAELVGNLVDGIAGIVGRRNTDRGVHVEIVDNNVVIELNVVLEYGVNIPKVSWQIQTDVREAIERMTGKAVRSVNIVVQSVQFPAAAKPERSKEREP